MNRRTEPPTPSCRSVREAVSARLDGEPQPVAAPQVREHLAGCAACARFADALAALAQRPAARADQPAAQPPDLTERILAARAAELAAAPASTRPAVDGPPSGAVRALVVLAGTVQLLVAAPALLGLVGPDLHVGRDLGALQLALGVGLVLAGLQPHRAAGVLPVAAAVAGATLLTITVDVTAGAATLAGELTHLSEFVGVVALWLLARRSRGPRPLPPTPAEAV